MLQHAQKHKSEKVSVPNLSTGLDKLNWLRVKVVIMDVFQDSLIKVTDYTQSEQQNGGPSGIQKQKKYKE